jgi:hypothetical protein
MGILVGEALLDQERWWRWCAIDVTHNLQR